MTSISNPRMRAVAAEGAPAASGHYSQAIVANGLVFVAGQLPLDPATREVSGGAYEQTKRALQSVAAILEAAGSGLDQVLTATVFITDIAHWPEVNRGYSEMMGGHKPARTVAVSPQLHFGCLVEIQVMALAPQG